MDLQVTLPEVLNEYRLLSPKQAMAFLGISRATLWRLTKNKKDPLPSVKIASNRKFQADKLRWWIEKQNQ